MSERRVGPFDRPYRRLTLGILLVITLAAFEAMAVATAMPTVVRELDGISLYAWGFSATLAAGLVSNVWAGGHCDAHGPRLSTVGGMAVFIAGLLLAGAAPNMIVFIAGRAVQGLGVGALIVAVYVLIARSYPEVMRPRLFSLISSAWVLPALIGPLVAGLVTDAFGWRWVFAGIAPLVVPAAWMMAPAIRDCGSLGGRLDSAARRQVYTACGVAAGAALLLVAGQTMTWWSLAPGAAGLALLVPLLPRLLPRGTLRFGRGLPSVIAMRGVLAGAFFATEAFIPLALTAERGLGLAEAGLCLTGGAVGWAFGSWLQGRPRASRHRPRLVQAGCVGVMLGIGGAALAMWPGITPWSAGLAWTFGGMGMGLAMATISVLVLELSPREQQGANSAALQVADTTASTLAIGLGGVILAAIHAGGGSTTVGVLAVDAVMVAVAFAGVFLAPRVRPRGGFGAPAAAVERGARLAAS